MKYYLWAENLTDSEWSCPYTTLKEALDEAKMDLNCKNGDTVYVMKGEPADIPDFNLDRVIEDMQDDAFDKAGEIASAYLTDLTIEDYLDLEDEIRDTIRKFFKKKKYMPNWYEPYYYKEFMLTNGKWRELK